jgi:hypothetical protein
MMYCKFILNLLLFDPSFQCDIALLHSSICHVIQFACKVNADSDQFPASWLFHYRWFKGKKNKKQSELRMPNGNLIIFETVGGRTSAVVPAVQKRKSFKDGATAAMVKKKKQSKRTIVAVMESVVDVPDAVNPPNKVKFSYHFEVFPMIMLRFYARGQSSFNYEVDEADNEPFIFFGTILKSIEYY